MAQGRPIKVSSTELFLLLTSRATFNEDGKTWYETMHCTTPYTSNRANPTQRLNYDNEHFTANEAFRDDCYRYMIAMALPANSVPKVYQKAWDDGHASGYLEVVNCLESLVELFV